MAPAGIIELAGVARPAHRVDGPARGRRSRAVRGRGRGRRGRRRPRGLSRTPGRRSSCMGRGLRLLTWRSDRRSVARRTGAQPARPDARHAGAAHARGVRARDRGLSGPTRGEPPGVRARQGDPARDGRARSRWRPSATAPRSATGSGPTTTACPISASTPTRPRRCGSRSSAISLGDRTGHGALMKLGGVGDQHGGADRVACRSRRRSRPCSTRSATGRS